MSRGAGIADEQLGRDADVALAATVLATNATDTLCRFGFITDRARSHAHFACIMRRKALEACRARAVDAALLAETTVLVEP